MKTIILGSSGYIGQRLAKKLKKEGNTELHLFNRNKNKISWIENEQTFTYDLELNSSNQKELEKIFNEADIVYYLIHSMSENNQDFENKDIKLAKFVSELSIKSKVKKIVYLGGLGNSDINLSKHLQSRQDTGKELRKYFNNVKEYRAGIIIGAGSSSFEIIRTLATKLPFIPVFWKKEGLCEPIFVDDVISLLKNECNNDVIENTIVEIGCNEQITYSNLVKKYSNNVLNRKLHVVNLNLLSFIFTPKIIGKIISIMTGQPTQLVVPLIYGVQNDAIVNTPIKKKVVNLDISLKLAAKRERSGQILSVWDFPSNLSHFDKPLKKRFGTQEKEGLLFEEVYSFIHSPKKIFSEVQKIGGENGYWSASFLWKARGLIDRLFGGLGLNKYYIRKDRTLHMGDRIDFWVVEYISDKGNEKVLRLKSEMKTPGNAWLQFSIVNNHFYLRAFFEPLGIFGYIYWYSLYPIHKFIFKQMVRNIIKKDSY